MRKVIFITFGVLAIIIIIAIAAIFIANMKFNQKVAKEVKELFAGISGSDDSVIQRSNLEKKNCQFL